MESADQSSFGGMYAQFSGRQGKNQPAMPGIDIREFEGIAEECPETVRIFRINERVDSIDHFCFTSDGKSWFCERRESLTTDKCNQSKDWTRRIRMIS
jgi:hypothetical protein